MLQKKLCLSVILIVLAVLAVLTIFSGCAKTADSDINDYSGEIGEGIHIEIDYEIESEPDEESGELIEVEDQEVPLAAWGSSEINVNEYAAEVFRLANIERKNAGLSDFSADAALTKAAVTRAKELIKLFSHERPDGRSCFTAYAECKVSYRAAAENIAAGQKTPESVIESWMNSPGHKANILNSKYGHLGVGVAVDSDGKIYWSMNFTD